MADEAEGQAVGNSCGANQKVKIVNRLSGLP
jgi:hypothetical protein